MARASVWVSPQRRSIFVVLALFSAVVAWAEPAKDKAESSESIVAIGDVHGDFDDFVAILHRTGLTDPQNHWTGGKTTFVQLGDLLDRGPKPREGMDLMMALEKEAAQASGRGVSLLGHEAGAEIDGGIFFHRGIYPDLANTKTDAMHKRIH